MHEVSPKAFQEGSLTHITEEEDYTESGEYKMSGAGNTTPTSEPKIAESPVVDDIDDSTND